MTFTSIKELPEFLILAREKGLDARPVVLRVQTDLLLMSPHQNSFVMESYVQLARELIPVVDDETVRIVGEKLARLSNLPQELIEVLDRRLAHWRPAVSVIQAKNDPQQGVIENSFSLEKSIQNAELQKPITVQSEVLEESSLTSVIDLENKSVARIHSQLFSDETHRPVQETDEEKNIISDVDNNDSEGIGRTYALNQEIDEDLMRVSNTSERLTRYEIDHLLIQAVNRQDIARLLLQRKDVTGADTAGLFLCASPEQRADIMAQVDSFAALARRQPSFPPLIEKEIAQVVQAARSHPQGITAEQLSRLTGIGETDSLHILADKTGIMLALALGIIRLGRHEAAAILLSHASSTASSFKQTTYLLTLLSSVSPAGALRIIQSVLSLARSAVENEKEHPRIASQLNNPRPVSTRYNPVVENGERKNRLPVSTANISLRDTLKKKGVINTGTPDVMTSS